MITRAMSNAHAVLSPPMHFWHGAVEAQAVGEGIAKVGGGGVVSGLEGGLGLAHLGSVLEYTKPDFISFLVPCSRCD